MSDRAAITHFRSFDAQRLGLAVDALTGGALVVDDLVERAVSIQQHPHQATFLPIGIFEASFPFGELGVFTGLACRLRKEQRAAKALGTIAISVLELVGGMHAQACRAVGCAIGITTDFLVAVVVEGNGGNAMPVSHRLIDIPVVVGGISRYVGNWLVAITVRW